MFSCSSVVLRTVPGELPPCAVRRLHLPTSPPFLPPAHVPATAHYAAYDGITPREPASNSCCGHEDVAVTDAATPDAIYHLAILSAVPLRTVACVACYRCVVGVNGDVAHQSLNVVISAPHSPVMLPLVAVAPSPAANHHSTLCLASALER